MISAFIKSIRGSDPDAALHYLARMLVAGEDPRFIARRLMVHASEDIGLADPTALQAAVAAAQVVQLVGLPECRLALAQATVHLATAPKSNAVITGDRRGHGRRAGRRHRSGAAAPARRALRRARRSWATPSATATRTTRRTACWPSSTRPTRWSAATTTARPRTAPSARWPTGCRSSAASSAASPEARSHTDFGARTPTAVAVPEPKLVCESAGWGPTKSHTNPGARTVTAVRV